MKHYKPLDADLTRDQRTGKLYTLPELTARLEQLERIAADGAADFRQTHVMADYPASHWAIRAAAAVPVC